MKNLKKYAGLLNDVAPEGEFLAYINEDESKILKEAGATGLLTPQGIPSYRGAGGYQGGGGSSSGGSSSGGSSSGGSSSGGSSGGGGGGGRDSGAQEAARQSAIAQEAANRNAVREQAAQEAAKQAAANRESYRSEQYNTPTPIPEIRNGAYIFDTPQQTPPLEAIVDPGFQRALEEIAPPSIGNEDDARLDYITGDYQDVRLDDPLLTKDYTKEFQDYREGISEAISPSTKTSNKIISSLLSSTLFPFAGNLYNKYIDATAMGYSVPNPFEGLFDGGNITPESIQNFQDQGGGGGGGGDNGTSILPNIPITGITPPQDSMVNQYFANQPISSLSSGLETSYNNAKSNINNILGIATPSQQFGYSQAPYGSYSSTNMAGNPYKDYLTTRGLI